MKVVKKIFYIHDVRYHKNDDDLWRRMTNVYVCGLTGSDGLINAIKTDW